VSNDDSEDGTTWGNSLTPNQPVAFTVPEGITCTGTINGIQNVCLAKIANANKNGPFGGVVAFQIAGANATAIPVKRAVDFVA